MNWIEALYRTYENCVSHVGNPADKEPLLPLSHTTQNAHIEVTLDGKGRFLRATVLAKEQQRTIIPCTEGSGGRSGSKPTNHPLGDKLQYLAGDFAEYGSTVTSGFSKDPSEPYTRYLADLEAWCRSSDTHPKLEAVLTYVKEKRLIADLVAASLLPVQGDRRTLLCEWSGDTPTPDIFKVLPPGNAPEEAFIRWAVEIPGEPESRLWLDPAIWGAWARYYESTQASTGLCYVLAREVPLAIQHPAKLRHAADKAKLISSNDSSGFTFRGRFTDAGGEQVCGVSFDVTQKAHNALRWLIARQGRRDGEQAIVAWAISGSNIPALIESTLSLFGEEKEDASPAKPSTDSDAAQEYALKLKLKIGGYSSKLGSGESIVVLALDSATPGRMAITYFQKIASSEFLARIERWHRECAWHQNFGKEARFIGAPSPVDIAICAYGSRLDERLRAAIVRRLLPSILDSVPIPGDLVQSCVRRASARQSIEPWEWERNLGIACSLYRKQQIDLNRHHYSMALERDRTTRSYLYGRLLAVADHLEGAALSKAGENRDTNAARFMQRFSDAPYATWLVIEKSLDPYRRRLHANAPGLLHRFTKELEEIMCAFSSDRFTDNSKLEGEFLLAYHCQRSALWEKVNAATAESLATI